MEPGKNKNYSGHETFCRPLRSNHQKTIKEVALADDISEKEYERTDTGTASVGKL